MNYVQTGTWHFRHTDWWAVARCANEGPSTTHHPPHTPVSPSARSHLHPPFSVCWALQSRPTPCDPTDCGAPGPSSMGFSRQEHWSGLPCPSPGDLPHPGTEPASLMSPEWAGGFFITSAPWKPSHQILSQLPPVCPSNLSVSRHSHCHCPCSGEKSTSVLDHP